jgi:hypothetical protein
MVAESQETSRGIWHYRRMHVDTRTACGDCHGVRIQCECAWASRKNALGIV